MRLKLFSALSAAAALGLLAPSASALDSNVNQVAGTISFSNTLLALPTFTSGSVNAYSLTPQTGLSASVNANVNGASLFYKVSVNASSFTHHISANAYAGNTWYSFAGQASPPVPNEPAADEQVDLTECAGLVHLRYLDAQTLAPVSVQNPSIQAFQPSGYQAAAWATQGSQLDFAVRGDGNSVHFNVSYSVGTDYYTDLIYYQNGYDQVVGCDQEVNVDVLIPSGGGTGTGSSQLGEIVGYFNLLGESEFVGESRVTADDGPFGNTRYSSVPGNPAEGPYDLVNLLPSATVSPARPWRVYGETRFKNALGVSQSFRSEAVHTLVNGGSPTSLGNTFVMSNQTLSGGIVIEGLDACSQKLQPTSSGTNTTAYSVNGVGYAQGPIKGGFLPSTQLLGNHLFAGNHLLAFGTPNNGNAAWNDYFNMYFQNPNSPNAATSIQFYNRAVGAIPSGNVPIQQCVGEFRMPLNVNTAGVETTFHAPSAVITGSFKGKDFASALADYAVYATSSGLPDANSPPVNSTVMPLCLPAGDYVVKPTVVAVSAAGEATTQLAEVANLTVGCGAKVNTDVVTVEAISCGDTNSIPFKMTARDVYSKIGVNQAIAHVTSGNGATFDVPICGGAASHACASGTAIADTFNITAPQIALLAACQNSVVVEVIDSVGNSSQSGVLMFTHENTTPSCQDVVVSHDAATGGAIVDISHALDNVSACGHRPTVVSPTVTSKFYPTGTAKAQLKFKTECSSTPYVCAFNVKVQ
jgi:hypothetical protein